MTPQKGFQNKQLPLLAPSLLSANFARLESEVKEVEGAGANWLHVDVMDGHFVPNLTFGPWVVEVLRPMTSLFLDCHLMVCDPDQWVEPFAKAGANLITVHVESTLHLDRTLNHIHELGCLAGVSLNPASPLALIEEVLDIVDLVLIMSVNPGFGGQKFIERSISKIQRLAQARGNRSFLIEVDGGVNAKNIGQLRKAGADVFVAGSAVFAPLDRADAIAQLKAGLGGK